jgi:hypothetical protein
MLRIVTNWMIFQEILPFTWQWGATDEIGGYFAGGAGA